MVKIRELEWDDNSGIAQDIFYSEIIFNEMRYKIVGKIVGSIYHNIQNNYKVYKHSFPQDEYIVYIVSTNTIQEAKQMAQEDFNRTIQSYIIEDSAE